MPNPDPTRLGVARLAAAYRSGSLDPVRVTEAFLERIEAGPVYRLVTAARARRQARAAARRFAAGIDAGPLDGVPIAIKDLVDTAGDVTGAGSPPWLERPPATDDAPVAARLDAAGAVFLGKTTMTELAFSGLGINPHVGTPPNAIDASRVPGGSSSGSAIAVARCLAAAAVGSDTGGSVRIPASFNGLVGLKTTDGWIPTEGTVALSTTLDTLGPIARDADDAWILAQAMAGEPPRPLPTPPQRWRLWAPVTVFWEDLDEGVADACAAAVSELEAAGHVVERRPSTELTALDELYGRYGSFAAHESLALYRDVLERDGDRMDPRVVRRILAARERTSTDYVRLVAERERLRSDFWQAAARFDAFVAPTVRVPPPLLAPLLTDDEAYTRANLAVLRATTLGNLLGGPVATVPVGVDRGGMPVGLSLATAPGEDALALALARESGRIAGA
jgi:aspartyl-tRNA(Asn)/glutamyl-tRNA(Gln) amidotransferase subunit A